MTRFIVIHRLPGAVTQDEVIAVGQAVTARLSDNARWLNSWLIPDDDRLFCEWEASSEEAIRAALVGVEKFPIEAIYPVERIDPAWFAG